MHLGTHLSFPKYIGFIQQAALCEIILTVTICIDFSDWEQQPSPDRLVSLSSHVLLMETSLLPAAAAESNDLSAVSKRAFCDMLAPGLCGPAMVV